MVPWNGSDGPYNVVTVGSYNPVYQGAGSPGTYAGFMYFQRPSGVNFTAGNPLYVEVDYLDQSGTGNISIQYNAVGNAFQNCNFGLNNSVYNTGAFKTAVFRLDNAAFALSQNGGNDMRLSQNPGNFQFNILQVRVSDAPTTLYNQATAFLGPYTGPTYVGGTPVDATTIVNKTVAGYQGWYGAPGDQDNIGWSHWLNGSQLQIDFWPDMAEYTPAERFNFPPYTNSGGGQAQLFSSDMARTTLRHFQWMEAWGIDGVAVQRFVGSVPSVPLDRVLSNVRLAANETGRTYFVEYDMSGMSEANLVSAIAADWNYLNNTLHITEDPRYLHQGGLPVIGIFGFFTDRFSTTTANAILDIFKTGSAHPAFVLGSGAWWWNEGTDATWTAAWKSVIYRMGAWQPWNVGNAGGSPLYAGTGYWANNKATLTANNVMFQPMLYAGCSSVNRDGLAPGAGVARLSGAVYWNQFSVAKSLNAQTAFIAMFDEFSEGTQIAKATASPPTNAPNALVYDGMPSDCYLCFTAQGSRWLKGLGPLSGGSYSSGSIPGCSGLTQPTIPDPISPLSGATVSTASTTFSWGAALALAGGGSLSGYVLNVDGTTYGLGNVLTSTLALSNGSHWWRVQAVNSLGNAGGWSVAQTFTVSAAGGTATRTPTRTTTPSASPSPSATVTPVVQGTWRINSGGPAYTDTLGHVWSADSNYSGGTVNGTANVISYTADPALYQDERWGAYSYTFNVPPGNYQVTLKFAELYWNAVASRVFNVSINGATVLTNLDLFAEKGQNWADDKVFDNITPSGGQIVIQLGPASKDNPTLDALQIIPEPATPTPSPSNTRTPTPTPSRTASPTLTATASPTRTATGSPTSTLLPTKTATPLSTATGSPTSTLLPTKTATPLPTATGSLTATLVPTKTATPLSTATGSPTFTLVPSKTVTPTNTPVFTLTASPTVSPLLTKTASPTSTLLSTATASPTASPLASKTATPTNTALPTNTSLPTATASPTASPPASKTASPTNTALPTATASPTASPLATKTASPTQTALPTFTRTSSPTASPLPTKTASPTSTPIFTVTASPTPSPVFTRTATPTGTGLATSTGSPTASPLATKTATPTNTILPSATASPSASPLATKTATPTNTVPATATLSPVDTATPSPVPSATGTVTASPGPSATATRTPVFSPTPSPHATWAANQNSEVLDAVPVPNPQAGPVLGFDVKLSKSCDTLTGTIYSPAMVLVARQSFSGHFTDGWNTLSWTLPPLPNGLYYVAFNTAFGRHPRVTRLYILH